MTAQAMTDGMRRIAATYAALAGSKATTDAGMLRAACAWSRRDSRHRIARAKAQEFPPRGRRLVARPVVAEMSRDERDTRRAMADAAFRPRFLARLRREESKLCAPVDEHDITAVCRAADGRKGAMARLAEIAALRSRIAGRDRPAALPDLAGALVALGRGAVEMVRRVGVHVVARGADWDIYVTRNATRCVHAEPETEWRNGKAVGYARATHDHFVRSVAVASSDGSRIDWMLHETLMRVPAPAGCRWDIDANGARIVRGRDDYHPQAHELWDAHYNGSDGLMRALDRNAEARRKAEAEQAALLADAEGVWVCLGDSLRGGNCEAGTLAWASRHGLARGRHYPAAELAGMVGDDAGRVRLAVSAAVRRHRAEMERGWADLAEHRVA